MPWSRQEKSVVLGFVKAKIAPLPGADGGPFPASWLRLSSLDKAELSPRSWELDCPHLLHHFLGCVVFRDHAWYFSSFLFVYFSYPVSHTFGSYTLSYVVLGLFHVSAPVCPAKLWRGPGYPLAEYSSIFLFSFFQQHSCSALSFSNKPSPQTLSFTTTSVTVKFLILYLSDSRLWFSILSLYCLVLMVLVSSFLIRFYHFLF